MFANFGCWSFVGGCVWLWHVVIVLLNATASLNTCHLTLLELKMQWGKLKKGSTWAQKNKQLFKRAKSLWCLMMQNIGLCYPSLAGTVHSILHDLTGPHRIIEGGSKALDCKWLKARKRFQYLSMYPGTSFWTETSGNCTSKTRVVVKQCPSMFANFRLWSSLGGGV